MTDELRYEIKRLDKFKVTDDGLSFGIGTVWNFDCPYCERFYHYNIEGLFKSAVKGHLREEHRIAVSFQTASFELRVDKFE